MLRGVQIEAQTIFLVIAKYKQRIDNPRMEARSKSNSVGKVGGYYVEERKGSIESRRKMESVKNNNCGNGEGYIIRIKNGMTRSVRR